LIIYSKQALFKISTSSTLQKNKMAGVVTYALGDWKLQSGQSIPNAEIVYKTFGNPNLPAVIYPSWFSGCELSASSSILQTQVSI
jgi:hypothetical protein